MAQLLIVTAVDAEHDAISSALDDAGVGDRAVVRVVGAGPATAAAGTAAAIGATTPALVISAGIAGGFSEGAGQGPIEILVADRIVFADLGAETENGFVSISTLGFGVDEYLIAEPVVTELAGRTRGRSGAVVRVGTVLTVTSVTGTQARAAELLTRHPNAVGEAMEGAGVAAAAELAGVPFAELRAVSNVVGPRDRAAWRIDEALAALAAAVAAVCAQPLPEDL